MFNILRRQVAEQYDKAIALISPLSKRPDGILHYEDFQAGNSALCVFACFGQSLSGQLKG
jgi:hypothetical protein